MISNSSDSVVTKDGEWFAIFSSFVGKLSRRPKIIRHKTFYRNLFAREKIIGLVKKRKPEASRVSRSSTINLRNPFNVR